MENKIKLTISTILTLLLASGGTYYLTDGDEAYYCQSKDMVMICEKLSSGLGTRCYYEDTYKICKEGWINYNFEELEDFEELEEIIPISKNINIKKLLCNQTICIPIK